MSGEDTRPGGCITIDFNCNFRHMNLQFNKDFANSYTSNSQIIRVLSEKWLLENVYCPSCGNESLNEFKNNNPAADFFCLNCKAEYELKSTVSKLAKKVVDGAYNSMINKILSFTNPNFFFLQYSLEYSVKNLFIIPKYFFIEDIIEKRKPLAENARRAGWIGCNILIHMLPPSGRIFLIKDESVIEPTDVLKQWQKFSFLNAEKITNRGWLLELIAIIEKIPQNSFTLSDVYAFAHILQRKFPHNKFIKEKIRQQLQVLRDKNIIRFMGKGIYQKI
jgi:type II restriction enzyme